MPCTCTYMAGCFSYTWPHALAIYIVTYTYSYSYKNNSFHAMGSYIIYWEAISPWHWSRPYTLDMCHTQSL